MKRGAPMKRTAFARKNNSGNTPAKVAQNHSQKRLIVIKYIAVNAKKRALNAVGCIEGPKQSTCMRGLHA